MKTLEYELDKRFISVVFEGTKTYQIPKDDLVKFMEERIQVEIAARSIAKSLEVELKYGDGTGKTFEKLKAGQWGYLRDRLYEVLGRELKFLQYINIGDTNLFRKIVDEILYGLY